MMQRFVWKSRRNRDDREDGVRRQLTNKSSLVLIHYVLRRKNHSGGKRNQENYVFEQVYDTE